MKFNPTLKLALALSVGVAGAAMAQNAATQTQPSAGQMQPGTPPSASQMQPSAGQVPSPTAQTPTAQTPATQLPQANAANAQQPTPTAINGNEQVRMAQQRLHAAGLYNGPEDGVMDPDTRAAIARYQQQNGLQRTESLDAATLANLQNSQTTSSGSTTPPPAAATPNPAAGNNGGNMGKSTAR